MSSTGFMIHGDALKMTLPFMFPDAPAGPSAGTGYTWQHFALGLSYNLASFNFNGFAFSDISEHAGHVAIDLMDITRPHRLNSPRCPTSVGP